MISRPGREKEGRQAGEKELWKTLWGLDPDDVCARAAAAFDPATGQYRLNFFSRTVLISPAAKTISGTTPRDDLLLSSLQDYAPFAIPGYLVHAKDILPSGKLIKPSAMKGGQIYLTGSHVLPLPRIAARYGSDRNGFLTRGRDLGGQELSHGDAAVRLFPFPRIAVALLLWTGDEEFAARADLLVDAACEAQLPPDIMWTTAMMSVLAML